MGKKIGSALGGLAAAVVSFLLVGLLLMAVLFGSGIQSPLAKKESVDVAVGERFRMYMTNRISAALDGVIDIEKVYWLSDSDLVAPKPNEACFGTADNAASLQWLLEDAQNLLDGQDTLFSTDTKVADNTRIHYYLDETIMTVTWKQAIMDTMYTISEVKIRHPSQFRRFLTGGSFGSGIQLKVTEMAASVNAVVASSGDYYAHRRMGISVYNGVVHRVYSEYLETCYIDETGDLLFSHRNELTDTAEAQKYVDDNNIRFSLAFGPVMIQNGEKRRLDYYAIGDIPEPHCRAALCQMGPLHYLLVTAGPENNCGDMISIFTFQDVLADFGCREAYNLDGGQTAEIVMNNSIMNRISYNEERDVSDIIYFATAIPNNE